VSEWLPYVSVVIPGRPQPWERAGVATRDRRGRPLWRPRFYTKKKTRAFETEVRLRVRWSMRDYDGPDRFSAFGLRLYVSVRRRRSGDLDNVAKGILDACNRMVWWDDGQVSKLDVEVVCGPSVTSEFVTVSIDRLFRNGKVRPTAGRRT